MVSFILPGNSATGGYEVDNSLRFNSGSSDYLNRTPGSAGNRKTYTLSWWMKIASIGTDRNIIQIQVDSNNRFNITLADSDKLAFQDVSSGTRYGHLTTSLFRDPSAWYHFVISVDTTQSTDSNRYKIYANNVEQGLSAIVAGYPPQNHDTLLNSTNETLIGKVAGGSSDLNGYIAEMVLIDGQALDPTSFGEFDEDSPTIWKPIDVSGLTFGTNGFYLDFENSGSLGADVSGNGNNFTVNNLTSIDQTTDTCTNNFATLNPLDLNTSASYSFSEGNVKTANTNFTRSTFANSSGKWYVESKCVSNTCWNGVRIIGSDVENEWTANSVALFIGGANLYIGGSNQGSGGYGSSWSANDIMMMALDLDSGTQKIYFGKNGGWWNGSDYSAGSPSTGVTLTSGKTWQFQFGSGSGTSTQEVNFGNPSFTISSGNSDGNGYGNFEYAVPSGYYALNTKNLAEYG